MSMAGVRIWFENGWYWEDENEKFGAFFSARSAIEDYRVAHEAWDLSVEEIAEQLGLEEEI